MARPLELVQLTDLHCSAEPSTACQFRPGTAVLELDDRPPGYRRITLSADGAIASRAEHVAPPRLGARLDSE